MSFLDDAGLAYFYNKIKQKFIRSITAMGADGQPATLTPDETGNVAVTRVATADNLTSPDGQTSFGTYIYRTSGGDVSLNSGPANLLYIDGNVNIVDRVAENIEASANNGIIITVDANIWRSQVVNSGTYQFTYTASTNSWSPDITTYGLTASNVVLSSVSASVSGSITSATVNKTTWETNSEVLETGSYYFYRVSDTWRLNNTTVNLANYGITVVGTPHEGDIITVNYIMATPNSIATVNYTKADQGIINVAKPTAFQATGFNQCDAALSNGTMYIADATISNNIITESVGSFACYCRAVGGVDNGYVAYSEGGYILNIGWCAELPQLGSTVVTTNQVLTSSSLASIPFEQDGYVVVIVSNKSDICIHPKWSGAADTNYEDYVEPSEIILPQTSIEAEGSVDLPLKSYGMPAVGAIADRLNLDSGIYIQRIGHEPYSVSNLALVQSYGVDYDYDDTNIFYVLPEPIIYTVNVDSNYIVNDWGTEEFLGTTVSVVAQTLYGQNLRDKLRLDVEPKKLLLHNVVVGSYTTDATFTGAITGVSVNLAVWQTMISDLNTYTFIYNGENWTYNNDSVSLDSYGISFSGSIVENDSITIDYGFTSLFQSNATYEDFGYRAAISLSGVTDNMIPEVIFNLTDSISGIFAPVAESYNGGIYIYASEVPETPLIIPTILIWRFTS